MSDFLPIIATAGLIAFVVTPLTLLLARRAGFVDRPSTRKVHLRPVPLLGGIAIYAGLLAGLIVFGLGEPLRELISVAGGATLVGAFGLWDDRYGMNPRVKLLGQGLAGALLVLGGVQTRLSNLPWIDVPLTIVWVIGISNAINFLDNMDGLAAGLSAVASASFLLLAIVNAQTLVAGLAAAVLGACLGFLFYNFSPAISFMGDTGSLMLGFTLAVLGIKLEFTGRNPFSTWMIPIVVLGVPIFDTTLVVLSRFRRKAAVAQGGTDHTSHRLVRLGMSHRRAVVALWAVSAALGVAGLWMSRASVLLSNLALGLLVAGGLLAVWILDRARMLPLPGQRPGLKPEMRVTVIACGEGLALAVRVATEISHDVRVLLTPVQESGAGWRQVTPPAFAAALVELARHPEAVRDFVLDTRPPTPSALAEPSGPEGAGSDFDVTARARAASSAFALRGSLLPTLDTAQGVSAGAHEALRTTDLIVLFDGDLGNNLLPTLAVPGLAEIVRHSKCPRVLVAHRPGEALEAIARAGGPGIVTHLITEGEGFARVEGLPCYSVADLADARLVGDALAQSWLDRGQLRLPTRRPT